MIKSESLSDTLNPCLSYLGEGFTLMFASIILFYFYVYVKSFSSSSSDDGNDSGQEILTMANNIISDSSSSLFVDQSAPVFTNFINFLNFPKTSLFGFFAYREEITVSVRSTSSVLPNTDKMIDDLIVLSEQIERQKRALLPQNSIE